MKQIKQILGRLSTKQLITIGAALLVSAGLLYALVHWRTEADFKPLYSGLAQEDSAAVVQKLKESGVEYRLSDSGDIISVPSAKLAELRLEMAAAGLPRTGRIGFEIFDKANLGATEFVEHVNYGRALEGELERTIGALSEVERARVHITFPKDSVFVESREAAKASVVVMLKPGAHLSASNVVAIAHLISSAVEGLAPDAVSVLDMQGNLLSKPVAENPGEAESEASLDYRQKIEHDLLQKISGTLDPLLGHEKYRASLSADIDQSSGEQNEEVMDPAKSAMLTSQKTEEIIGAPGSGGIPGTASNLSASTTVRTSGLTTTRHTENITWQPSKVTRVTRLPQGTLKRLSVAVLLDQGVKWEGSGKTLHRVLVPPPPETLQSVKDVVTAAIGFVPDRDQITVETLPFEETLNEGPPQTGSPVAHPPANFLLGQPMMNVIGYAILAVLVLIGGVAFMLRSALVKKSATAVSEGQTALPGAGDVPMVESDPEAALEAQIAQREEEQRLADMETLASIKAPPVKTKKAEILAKQIREITKKDVAPSVQILQDWIRDR